MLKFTIEAANLAELREQIEELAENFAIGTNTAAITPSVSPLTENTTAEVQQAAKPATKRNSKKKGADVSENVSGASDEKFPAGASASPNAQTAGASVQSTAPATPDTNPFNVAPPAPTPHLTGQSPRDQLSTAINAFLDKPDGGMDNALRILGKYGAKKMSDVMDAQIPAVIAELSGAQPQVNSIFS